MAKVTMYRSTDGVLHETHEKYLDHEFRMRLKKAADLCTDFDMNAFEVDDSGDMRLSIDKTSEFIADNATILIDLLKASTVSLRGKRRAKSAA